MRARFIPTLLVGIFVSGCAMTAHLYPANDVATSGGVLEAHFTAYGTGHTTVSATMPDGEILTGEATVVRGGSMGFGTIFASVYGAGGSAAGSGISTSYNIPGGSPGMASLFGTKGTSMECEFYNDNFSGHGYGGCKSSKGGLYRLQY